MHDPLIINFTPTGMVPTREDTPFVPIATGEILEDVARAAALGASIVHVHARDDQGRPTHRADHFAPIVEGIREIDSALVVCVTCSGRRVSDVDARAEVLELDGPAKPDMASLTLGSNNLRSEASVNAPAVIRELASRMAALGIRPELEAFEPGMVAFARTLVAEGVVEAPCYVNVLLGNPGTSPLDPAALGAFVGRLPEDWTWALAGIGRHQLDAALVAIALGGHVRIGLEDNIWWDRGRTTHATNEMLVRRVADAAALAERPLASPDWTRDRLGLAPRTVGTQPRVATRT